MSYGIILILLPLILIPSICDGRHTAQGPNLGTVDFGFGIRENINLEHLGDVKKVERLSKDVFNRNDYGQKAVDDRINGFLLKNEKLLENVMGHHAVSSIVWAGVSSQIRRPDVMNMLNVIKNLIIDNHWRMVDHIDDRFDEKDWNDAYRSYRDHFFQHLIDGVDDLEAMMEKKNRQSREDFEQWCIDHRPRSMAKHLETHLDIGSASLLTTFIKYIDYDKTQYSRIEEAIGNHLAALETLHAFCKDKEGDHDLIKTEARIRDKLRHAREVLTTNYWPGSVKRMARAVLDGGGSNQEKADKIWKELKTKHGVYKEFTKFTHFFVGVYNDVKWEEKHYIKKDDHWAIHDHHNGKQYVIFRSGCFEHGMRDQVKNSITSHYSFESKELVDRLYKQIFRLHPKMVLAIRNGNDFMTQKDDCTVHFVHSTPESQGYVIGLS